MIQICSNKNNSQLSKDIKNGNKKRIITRNKFLPSEDTLIRQVVEQYGPNFEIIEQVFNYTRTRRQLRERWQNYLAPTLMIMQKSQNDGNENVAKNDNCDIKKKMFTEEENQVIMEQFMLIGPKWAQISRMIGGKSAVLVRNQWRRLAKQMNDDRELKNTQLITHSPITAQLGNYSDNQKKTKFEDLFDFQFLNDFDLDCYDVPHLNAGTIHGLNI